MKLRELLEQYVAKQGGGFSEPDPLGVYRMTINDRFLLHFCNAPRDRGGDEYFYIYSKVGSLPQSPNRLSLCETLLEANLFGDGSGLAFFALHRSTNTILMMICCEAEATSYEKFERDLQGFVSHLAYWKKRVGVDSSKEQIADLPSESDILTIMASRKQKVLFV